MILEGSWAVEEVGPGAVVLVVVSDLWKGRAGRVRKL